MSCGKRKSHVVVSISDPLNLCSDVIQEHCAEKRTGYIKWSSPAFLHILMNLARWLGRKAGQSMTASACESEPKVSLVQITFYRL